MRVLRVIAVALIAPACAVAYAANEDGSAVAVLDGGRTLVPVRAVTEWLGASVQYDAARGIEIRRGGTTVNLRAGSGAALLNGEAVVLDQPPIVLAGVTYVPARFVAESFGAAVEYDGRSLTMLSAGGDRQMELRVAVRKGDRLTYRGPWFDIDYPASFRPAGYDHAPGSTDYDRDGMRFVSPDGRVEFFAYSPQWSGDAAWATVWPGERIVDRSTGTEGSGFDAKQLTWVTVAGPEDAYRRSWLQIHQAELNVKYFFGIRFSDQTAYDRSKDAYAGFRQSLVQYAD